MCDYAKKKYDAIAYKFTSPQRRNVPDRIVVFPNGVLIFIEFKAPGKLPTEGQNREISRLKYRGQTVLLIDDIMVGKSLIEGCAALG